MFKIDVGEEGKYLFQILAETLGRANLKHDVTIPWYIMTSRENNEKTVEFLQKHDFFGYPKDYVGIFEQEELPLLDMQGKLIMDENMLIKEASNGNGGVFSSMAKKGVLEDMYAKGVEWVFVGGIDNVLLKLVDLPLVGLCIKKGTEVAAKTVLKARPEERVGVFCKRDDKVRIVEYTELPPAAASKVNEYGELVFGETNIIAHIFSLDAITKASSKNMPYHVALKKSNYIDKNEVLVVPEEPNCYKFEKFIFDAFALFDEISLYRGIREKDYAPIKNASGLDSPQTAKELYEKYWREKNNAF
ncbi:MAG: UTP--glucose-1-phosphate uridylyltransferase [Oscillospiraceae bacterium]|nr:UTP--glucose-1-phosphate uridylyltransferase [Oscillospiraceae bacterium]